VKRAGHRRTVGVACNRARFQRTKHHIQRCPTGQGPELFFYRRSVAAGVSALDPSSSVPEFRLRMLRGCPAMRSGHRGPTRSRLMSHRFGSIACLLAKSMLRGEPLGARRSCYSRCGPKLTRVVTARRNTDRLRPHDDVRRIRDRGGHGPPSAVVRAKRRPRNSTGEAVVVQQA